MVLPFVNLGGGPDREYIADGFTEDVIAALGQVDPDHLTVIGRASVMSLSLRGFILASTGRTDEARAVATALEALANERYMPAYAVALVYAGLGDTERALEWLDRAYTERDVHLIVLVVDPKWETCASDPRFRRLVERCGFAPTTRATR